VPSSITRAECSILFFNNQAFQFSGASKFPSALAKFPSAPAKFPGVPAKSLPAGKKSLPAGKKSLPAGEKSPPAGEKSLYMFNKKNINNLKRRKNVSYLCIITKN
jgi:hypothetical protein